MKEKGNRLCVLLCKSSKKSNKQETEEKYDTTKSYIFNRLIKKEKIFTFIQS